MPVFSICLCLLQSFFDRFKESVKNIAQAWFSPFFLEESTVATQPGKKKRGKLGFSVMVCEKEGEEEKQRRQDRNPPCQTGKCAREKPKGATERRTSFSTLAGKKHLSVSAATSLTNELTRFRDRLPCAPD